MDMADELAEALAQNIDVILFPVVRPTNAVRGYVSVLARCCAFFPTFLFLHHPQARHLEDDPLPILSLAYTLTT